MNQIIWLASYPKSGNTWFRALLANYFSELDEPVDINAMQTGPIASARQVFDEHLGVAASDLTFTEVTHLRPEVYRYVSDKLPAKQFTKVHDAFLRSSSGKPVFPAEATHAAVYLIRNPLDVCISYANHNNCSIDRAIELMNEPEHQLAPRSGGLPGQLPQRMGTWSNHVTSWVDQKEFPVRVVRYEDLKVDPVNTFAAALEFLGLEIDLGRVELAVEFSSFDRLKRQEMEKGFLEKPIQASSFFREGKSGGWRARLAKEQWARVRTTQEEVMRRFDYWEEASDLVDSINFR